MKTPRILITGGGAICGAGQTPEAILAALLEGRTAIGPITQWDTAGWPVRIAAEVPDYNAGKLTGDRKLLKHIRRGDVFGLYAADQAIEQAGFTPWRESLDETGAERFADGTGVFVPLWMCVRQPTFAVATPAGAPLSSAVTLFARSCCESSGCRIEYVPADPQQR